MRQIVNRVKATAEAMGCELSAEALELFAFDLLPYPDDEIAEALVRCRREIGNEYGRKLTIKDVYDRLGVVTPEQESAAVADLAWSKVVGCLYRCADCPMEHLDERKRDKLAASGDERLLHAVRVCGGWRRITDTPPANYGFLKKEFVQAYTTYDVARAVEHKQLAGLDVKFFREWNKMP